MPDPIALALTDVQQVVGHIGETDSQGNAVEVDGLSATSSDESVVSATLDGADITIATVGPTGVATVSIADTDDNLFQDVNVAVGTSDPTDVAVVFDEPTDRTV